MKSADFGQAFGLSQVKAAERGKAMSPNSSMNDTDEREVPVKASPGKSMGQSNRQAVAVDEDAYET